MLVQPCGGKGTLAADGVPRGRHENKRVSARGRGWYARVSGTQAQQPHWITPLVTVTPRLEEEFRFDLFRQSGQAGVTKIYGAGKGLELIPRERVEVILGVPPEIQRAPGRTSGGLGDTSFLLKYRVRSASEENGNSILTVFLGATAPTGKQPNGAGRPVVTPAIAFGKGWGNFDVQTTFGVGLPIGGMDRLGTPLMHNVAFQYRLVNKLWPELEVNSTWWPNGERSGKKQVFLTPGLVLGRLRLRGRLGLTLGAGLQVAATRFRLYNRNWIFSIRLPF